MKPWTCPDCGQTTYESEFAARCGPVQEWSSPWPEGVRKHWPSGLPATSADASFAVRHPGQANGLRRPMDAFAEAPR